MSNHMSRRSFLETTKNACGAVALFGLTEAPLTVQDTAYDGESDTLPPEFPGQDRNAVRAVVGASHAQFDRVKELVTARPALAKASWDWGFGDWESALGAASHTGRRDIAELLMAHGARPNIFTYTMLGELAVVKSMVEATPGIQRSPGPHGITLLQHARNRLVRKGLPAEDEARARQMVSYLESLGDADRATAGEDITEAQKEIYLGVYTFGSGSEDTFTVELHRRGWLMLKRGTQSGRQLHLVEPHAFAPSGASEVRIRFVVTDNKAVSLTIHDPVPLVRAVRKS